MSVTKIDRDVALNSIRDAKGTVAGLFEKAGAKIVFEGDDNPYREILQAIMGEKWNTICTMGPPKSKIPATTAKWDKVPAEIRSRTNDLRKRVTGFMVKDGIPIERSTDEIKAAIAGNDPHMLADLDRVLDLMRAEENGFGDLVLSSGKRRGAAYCVKSETAAQFGYPFKDENADPIYKERKIKDAGKDSPAALDL